MACSRGGGAGDGWTFWCLLAVQRSRLPVGQAGRGGDLGQPVVPLSPPPVGRSPFAVLRRLPPPPLTVILRGEGNRGGGRRRQLAGPQPRLTSLPVSLLAASAALTVAQ